MSALETVKAFRFWCHKIIPLVYDDSLSYYEFLCKVMQKLNEVIDSLNAQNEEIESFEREVREEFIRLREELTEEITRVVGEKFQDFISKMFEPFSTTKNYLEGDYVWHEDNILIAKNDITAGDFDPADWDTIIFATDLANWKRTISARLTQFITDINEKISTWIDNIANEYDETRVYTAGDIINHDDKILEANGVTTGAYDSTKWDEIILCDWVLSLVKDMEIQKTDKAFAKGKNIYKSSIVMQADSVVTGAGLQGHTVIPAEFGSTFTIFLAFSVPEAGINSYAMGDLQTFKNSIKGFAFSSTNVAPSSYVTYPLKWFDTFAVATITNRPSSNIYSWLVWDENHPASFPSQATHFQQVIIAYTNARPFSPDFEAYGSVNMREMLHWASSAIDGVKTDLNNFIGQESNFERYVASNYTERLTSGNAFDTMISEIDSDVSFALTGNAFDVISIPITVKKHSSVNCFVIYGADLGAASLDNIDDAIGTIQFKPDDTDMTTITATFTHRAKGIYFGYFSAPPEAPSGTMVSGNLRITLSKNIGVSVGCILTRGRLINDHSVTSDDLLLDAFGLFPQKLMGNFVQQFVGSAVMPIMSNVSAITGRLGGLSFVKCTQTEYDNMSSHDANTIYFIV